MRLLPATFLAGLVLPMALHGQAPKPGGSDKANQQSRELTKRDLELAREAERLRIASSKSIRRFHEVLRSLILEFTYDLKAGDLNKIKNMSVRRVEVNKSLPKSYRRYIKLLAEEKIRENSPTRIIQCVPCETKSSKLEKGKLVIISPTVNLNALQEAASQLGIEYFMDIVFLYHATHMVLAFKIFSADTSELVWSRTYNSEIIKSRYQRLAVDYDQVMLSRGKEKYTPEYHYLIGVGGGAVPNVAGALSDSVMMAVDTRATEKFDNRRFEFGLLLTIYLRIKDYIGEYPSATGSGGTTSDPNYTTTGPQPDTFSYALYLGGIFAKNFLGEVESYNHIRIGANLSAGAFVTLGFLTAQGRLGMDLYFGRRWSVTFALTYMMPSDLLIQETTMTTQGGVGGYGVVSVNL